MTLNMDEVQEASASSSPTIYKGERIGFSRLSSLWRYLLYTRERESDSRDSRPSGGTYYIQGRENRILETLIPLAVPTIYKGERIGFSRLSSLWRYSECSLLATKRKRTSPIESGKSAGRFKHNWSLPRHIASSSKGCRFAYCRLCDKHSTVSHGGFNDAKRHVNGAVHQRRIRSTQGSDDISNLLTKSQEHSLIHSANVTSAEIMMVKFIAMHNLSFKAADHLTLSCVYAHERVKAADHLSVFSLLSSLILLLQLTLLVSEPKQSLLFAMPWIRT